MPGETTFQKIKYALGIDEVKKYPVEVSEPGAKTIDKYLEEHTLTAKTYAGNATLKSGELAIQETAATIFTLPSAATANQLITCYCGLVSSVNVKAQAGQKIYGDFIKGATTITLMELQHVTVQSNGTAWDIIAGEPKRESEYATVTGAVSGESFVPSVTRPSLVTVICKTAAINEVQLVGPGIQKLFNTATIGMGAVGVPLTFEVLAGQVFKVVTSGAVVFDYTYLLR